MNLSSGYPFWLIREGLPYDYPKLLKDTRADVVILGGGISGALIAFYLQQAGIQAMVVDGRTLGLGSTCASTSLLLYELDTPLWKLKNMIGEKAAIRAYELSVNSIPELEKIAKTISFMDIQPKKSIHYAAFKKHVPQLIREFEARKQMGLSVKWLDAALLEKKYGILAPAAILSQPAAQTNAYSFTHALHQYNRKKGVKIYDRTWITRTAHDKKRIVLHTADGHRIQCKKLVHATGYETLQVIDKKSARLTSSYAVASEQFNTENSFFRENILLWGTGDPYLYIRTTSDRRIIVGGRDEDFFSPGKRDDLILKKSRQLSKDFEKLVPGINFRGEFSWAGTFGSTNDGLPVIGPYPGYPGNFLALGLGGNGITFAQIAGRLICDGVQGKPNRDTSLFSLGRL